MQKNEFTEPEIFYTQHFLFLPLTGIVQLIKINYATLLIFFPCFVKLISRRISEGRESCLWT